MGASEHRSNNNNYPNTTCLILCTDSTLCRYTTTRAPYFLFLFECSILLFDQFQNNLILLIGQRCERHLSMCPYSPLFNIHAHNVRTLKCGVNLIPRMDSLFFVLYPCTLVVSSVYNCPRGYRNTYIVMPLTLRPLQMNRAHCNRNTAVKQKSWWFLFYVYFVVCVCVWNGSTWRPLKPTYYLMSYISGCVFVCVCVWVRVICWPEGRNHREWLKNKFRANTQ